VLSDETICNTLPNPCEDNFLTTACADAYRNAQAIRTARDAGTIEPRRAKSNLLSSQPMVFNAFGEMAADLDLATRWLKLIDANATEVNALRFEFQPESGDIGDNSAFDVALDYRRNDGPALLGLEVKYTDDFSAKRKHGGTWYGGPGDRNESSYKAAYSRVEHAFRAPYDNLVQSTSSNQLFRNSLIAETAKAVGEYTEVTTGLLCHPGDRKALAAGRGFEEDINQPFLLLTLRDLVTQLQQLELTWSQREWTALLWARYLGLRLSDTVCG